jgi:hypothetical protein
MTTPTEGDSLGIEASMTVFQVQRRRLLLPCRPTGVAWLIKRYQDIDNLHETSSKCHTDDVKSRDV